jgi:hypothetical protein
MARNIRVRAIKRREVDEDKLALAFLMLAKVIHEQERGDADNYDQVAGSDLEAA